MTNPGNRALKIAGVQQTATRDRERSLASSEALIREAASAGAELVVLQELHCTDYFCQTEALEVFELAEPIPGPGSERLGRLARELDIVIVGSLFEKRAPGLFHNTAVVLERDGTLAGSYRKMHIPDDPGFYEKFYFTPGDAAGRARARGPGEADGFKPIQTSLGRLGVLVCWDQWYPEAARLMALAGADLLIYPTAIGWDPDDNVEEQARQREAWLCIQRAHAVANHLPLIAVNRVGHEPDPSGQTAGSRFWGSSFICGPQGEYLTQADTESTCVIHATVDPARTEHLRRIWPYLRDRRIDAYDDLLLRWRD